MAEQTSISRRRASASRRKPKKNQIPFGVTLVALIVIIGIALGMKHPTLSLFG